MKTIEYKSLGLSVKLSVPESVEEFDANAKKSGACLTEATNNVVYRGSLADFREKLCEKVEADYAIERATKDTGKKRKVEVKNADGTTTTTEEAIVTYSESEAEFIKRVVADKNIKIEDLQPTADAIAAELVFDASATERKPSAPKKLAAKYVEDAKKVLASGNIDKVNVRMSGLINKTFTSTGDADKDATALGWLIKEYAEALEAQTRAQLIS
jgi:hypothetical protein